MPQNLVLKGAENHSYRIGLNLIPNSLEKRSYFYNPLLIFSVNIVTVIKAIISVSTPEKMRNSY